MKEKNLVSYNGHIRLGISVEDRKWAESDAQRKEILSNTQGNSHKISVDPLRLKSKTSGHQSYSLSLSHTEPLSLSLKLSLDWCNVEE